MRDAAAGFERSESPCRVANGRASRNIVLALALATTAALAGSGTDFSPAFVLDTWTPYSTAEAVSPAFEVNTLTPGSTSVAVSGGFPVGGSFSRSSLNRQAGARTRLAGAVTGVAVLCFLPFATVLAPLPLPVLAAIVIVAALGLVRLRPLARLGRLSRWQAAVAWTTFIATIVLSPHVEYAVLIGVGMAIVVHLLREMLVDIEVALDGDRLIFRPRGVLWFASSKVIEDAFAVAIADHPEASRVDIDLAGVGRLDVTTALVLRGMLADARAAKLEARLVDIPPRARRFLLPVVESDDEPL